MLGQSMHKQEGYFFPFATIMDCFSKLTEVKPADAEEEQKEATKEKTFAAFEGVENVFPSFFGIYNKTVEERQKADQPEQNKNTTAALKNTGNQTGGQA